MQVDAAGKSGARGAPPDRAKCHRHNDNVQVDSDDPYHLVSFISSTRFNNSGLRLRPDLLPSNGTFVIEIQTSNGDIRGFAGVVALGQPYPSALTASRSMPSIDPERERSSSLRHTDAPPGWSWHQSGARPLVAWAAEVDGTIPEDDYDAVHGLSHYRVDARGQVSPTCRAPCRYVITTAR